MKRIDKLVLVTFLGLFLSTFLVGFFIILMQFFLVEFDKFVGKGLDWSIYLQVSYHVCLFAVKQAFPFAILLASITAMGRLGEHRELIALKSAGISLPRILRPIFFAVCFLTLLAWCCNSYLVPRAFLDAYSLVYDLSTKKPALALKEGVFYDEIPGYSIKVDKKIDENNLRGVMIYDHTREDGRVALTTAATGKLYATANEDYLVLELFDGYDYREVSGSFVAGDAKSKGNFLRSNFKSQKLMLSLASFKLSRTDQDSFSHDERTRNASQLSARIVAIREDIEQVKHSAAKLREWGDFILTEPSVALPATADALAFKSFFNQEDATPIGVLYTADEVQLILKNALKQAQDIRWELSKKGREIRRLKRRSSASEFEWHKMIAWSAACVFVFFIGAPLGAIIKGGGLVIPVLFSGALIMWHYIVQMIGESAVAEGALAPLVGAWLPNLALLPFCIFFYVQAYRDARMLEADFYAVMLGKVKKYMTKVFRKFRR